MRIVQIVLLTVLPVVGGLIHPVTSTGQQAPPTLYAGIEFVDGIDDFSTDTPQRSVTEQVIRSLDGGNTWHPTALEGAPSRDLRIAPSDPNTIYGRTKDFASDPTTQMQHQRGALPSRCQQMIDDTIDTPLQTIQCYFVKSTDGGGSWERGEISRTLQFPLIGFTGTWDYHPFQIHPTNAQRIYTAISIPAFTPTTDATIGRFDGWKSVIVTSTDGGDNWTDVRSGTLGNGRLSHLAIAPSDPETLYAVWRGETNIRGEPVERLLQKTINGGRDWTSLTLPGDDIIFFPQLQVFRGTQPIQSLTIDPNNPNTLYVTVEVDQTERQGLYKSLDGGATWNNLTENIPDPIFETMEDEIRRTLDFTIRANQQTSFGGPVVAPSDSNTLYLRVNFFSTSDLDGNIINTTESLSASALNFDVIPGTVIYKSTDGGQTFVDTQIPRVNRTTSGDRGSQFPSLIVPESTGNTHWVQLTEMAVDPLDENAIYVGSRQADSHTISKYLRPEDFSTVQDNASGVFKRTTGQWFESTLSGVDDDTSTAEQTSLNAEIFSLAFVTPPILSPDFTATLTKRKWRPSNNNPILLNNTAGEAVDLWVHIKNAGDAIPLRQRVLDVLDSEEFVPFVLISVWISDDEVLDDADTLLTTRVIETDNLGNPESSQRLIIRFRELARMNDQFIIVEVNADHPVGFGPERDRFAVPEQNKGNNFIVHQISGLCADKNNWRLEQEPNSGFELQNAGKLRGGRCTTIRGTLDAPDDVDGFRLRIREDMRLDTFLSSDDPAHQVGLVFRDLDTGSEIVNLTGGRCTSDPSACPVRLRSGMTVEVTARSLTSTTGDYTLAFTPVIGATQ